MCPLSTSHTSYGWQTGANRVMLLSDDRNLPMPLQKTQISTISFGHSVGTGRRGVRPAPDVPRGCPPHSFLRQEGPANPSAANFPQSAVLRLLPTRETLAQQYACWRRRIPLRDGAQSVAETYAATMDMLVLQIFNSLFYASVLFLIAAGLSLIFGVMRIVNMAHSSAAASAG